MKKLRRTLGVKGLPVDADLCEEIERHLETVVEAEAVDNLIDEYGSSEYIKDRSAIREELESTRRAYANAVAALVTYGID